MCDDRDTVQFVIIFTVWMFAFVSASCGHVCDCTAFLLLFLFYPISLSCSLSCTQ